MGQITKVLQDAERKRIESPVVADWVRELKDVLYDAEDIIDLCCFEGGKLLDDQPSSSSTPPRSVRCNFPSFLSCFGSIPFRHEIGNKIEELNKRLDQITKDVSDLNFLQNEPDHRVTRVNLRDTTQLLDYVVGSDIEQATNKLVDLIAKKDDKHKCRLFVVTGMGGIGKTTLAQNIFNHKNTQSAFPTKIWVCISQNFSETELLKEIIRGAGGDHGNLQTTAELLPKLKSVISGNPFFLVLDDVWCSDVWDRLRIPFQSEAVSSCVLVTTRNINVAREMGEVYIHPVEKLSKEYGWELLCKSAFVTRAEEMRSLRDVGLQIVRKCDGLPLAIKTVAGVLKTKERSRGEWEKVIARKAWFVELPDADLRGALYMSYEDLPSHLKPCFVYLSLYAEDSRFSREDVARAWVVEGYAAPTRMEAFLELGDAYFEELVRRNLIQKADILSSGSWYQMHDLLRALSVFLSRDESFCGEADQITTISNTTKLRRVSLINVQGTDVLPESLLKQNISLRTLRLVRGFPMFGENIFKTFSSLRYLLINDSELKVIPDALGNLIHLRNFGSQPHKNIQITGFY